MDNITIKCDVGECMHNEGCTDCSLSTIEVSSEQTGENAVETPHFCKSFEEK